MATVTPEAGVIRDRLIGSRVIPVLRLRSVAQARTVIDCLLSTGFATVEITLTTPDALDLIADLRSRVPQSFLIGAGTILNLPQAQQCLDAGADYLVSPCVVRGMAGLAHAAGRAALLGAFTPSEVRAACDEGSDAVKLFPASSGGPSHLAALKAVFPEVAFCPTGGIDADNMAAYFGAGAAMVGVGNSIIDRKALSENDLATMTLHARHYLELATAQD